MPAIRESSIEIYNALYVHQLGQAGGINNEQFLSRGPVRNRLQYEAKNEDFEVESKLDLINIHQGKTDEDFLASIHCPLSRKCVVSMSRASIASFSPPGFSEEKKVDQTCLQMYRLTRGGVDSLFHVPELCAETGFSTWPAQFTVNLHKTQKSWSCCL